MTMLSNVLYFKNCTNSDVWRYFSVHFNKIFYLLKLACHHINHRHICFNIKSISVHPLLWMNVMLDFICMVFAELLSTRYKRKIQNNNVCLRRVSHQRPRAFQHFPLIARPLGLLTICNQNFCSTYSRYDTTKTLCGVQRGI